MRLRSGIVGLVAGAVVAVGCWLVLGPTIYVTLPVATVGLTAGFVRGSRTVLYRCATCRSFVSTTSTECGHCGGRIVGDIKNANERLDREEELEQLEQ